MRYVVHLAKMKGFNATKMRGKLKHVYFQKTAKDKEKMDGLATAVSVSSLVRTYNWIL